MTIKAIKYLLWKKNINKEFATNNVNKELVLNIDSMKT